MLESFSVFSLVNCRWMGLSWLLFWKITPDVPCRWLDGVRARASRSSSSNRNALHPLLLSSYIHPPPVRPALSLLLQPRRGHSEREGRRTKPRWKKWPFNSWQNKPEETWILWLFPSTNTSSSSLPWAASTPLLTGDSVSTLADDYFLNDNATGAGSGSSPVLLTAPFFSQDRPQEINSVPDLCQYCSGGAGRNRRAGSLQLHLSRGKTNTVIL